MDEAKRKPAVEAIQWKGNNLFAVVTFLEGKEPDIDSHEEIESWDRYTRKVSVVGLSIRVGGGRVAVPIGDFIIRGEGRELGRCKADELDVLYEYVEGGLSGWALRDALKTDRDSARREVESLKDLVRILKSGELVY